MPSDFTPPTAIAAEDTDSAPIRRFAEILQQYDPRFSLEYVPEGDRVNASVHEILHPFRIVEQTPVFGLQVVRYLDADEMKNPGAVLAWIFEGDLSKNRPKDVINRIELRERADRMLTLAAQRDAAQERQDQTAFLVSGGRDQKHYLRLDKNRTLARG